LPSLQTFKRALKTELFRRSYSSGNSSIDTSLIRGIYCGPEVLFETCVAMKFVDDDDDDDDNETSGTRIFQYLWDTGTHTDRRR